MYKGLRHWTLTVLKTPPEPRPPAGDPASLKVFNAGRNYFRLRIGSWAIAEAIALGGLIFWTIFLIEIEKTAREKERSRPVERVAADGQVRSNQTENAGADPAARRRRTNSGLKGRINDSLRAAAREAGIEGTSRSRRLNGWAGFKRACAELALLLPAGAFVAIWTVKIFSMLLFLLQIPITYAVRRLDYEMRWYMVTDRSLRIRHGVWQISESTMSFANIQQVVVSQGPLQRLLGLADVKVTSAGGGGEGSGPHHHGDADMHAGLFHSVSNAAEIRDLILERLRRFREAGLGDPDEQANSDVSVKNSSSRASSDAVATARQIVEEARLLRSALTAETRKSEPAV